MFKIITTIVTILLSTIFAMAQPVIYSNNVSYSFTGEFYFTTTAGFSPGSAGANQTWNFSSMNLTLAGTDAYVAVVNTPFASTFPTANHCLVFTGFGQNYYNYSRVTSGKFEILSKGYTSASSTNYNANPRTFVEFPYTYNS